MPKPKSFIFFEFMSIRLILISKYERKRNGQLMHSEAIMLGIYLVSSILINLTYCLHLNTLQLTSSLSPSSPASFPPYHLPSFVPVVWNDLTFSIIPTSCLSSDVKIRKTKISYTAKHRVIVWTATWIEYTVL